MHWLGACVGVGVRMYVVLSGQRGDFVHYSVGEQSSGAWVGRLAEVISVERRSELHADLFKRSHQELSWGLDVHRSFVSNRDDWYAALDGESGCAEATTVQVS